ncbi:MAG: GIY-YIG nuclease family protein [Caldilineaceae bacterium]
MSATLPTAGGIYVLLLELAAAQPLAVGRLGQFALSPGWYAYAGSAHGPGGLRGRMAHHLRPVLAPHWHIDALRVVAPLRAIWWCHAPAACEHVVAAALATMPGALLPIPRFGAADCHCPAHLVCLPQRPTLKAFSSCVPACAREWQEIAVALPAKTP